MAMANNWISFSFPPLDMVLYPYTHDQNDHPLHFSTVAGFDDGASYQCQFLPQALKMEDFLGPCGEPLQESSSPSTAHHHDPRVVALPGSSVSSEVEDAASATAGKLRHSPDHSGADFALSVRPPPPPAVAPARPEVAVAVEASCQRTSIYRGVTRHRWTGRYEAHLWDNTCRREGQKRKGRQVYLGGYDNEEKAARAYDLAALKYWGLAATTNFPVQYYSKEMEEMKHICKPEFIASLRRKSSGFSRGASIYRGVTRHHQHGRWQARIGRVAGNKDLYLGTFSTEEEAAEAYDVAAIKFRGANAITNFELSRYNVEAIANSELPIGATAKRIKQSLQASSSNQVTVVNPAISQHQDIVPSALHNLLQLYPAAGPSCSLPFMNTSENEPDLCSQRLYWLTTSSQHDNQILGNQQVVESDPPQLTHLAPSQ